MDQDGQNPMTLKEARDICVQFSAYKMPDGKVICSMVDIDDYCTIQIKITCRLLWYHEDGGEILGQEKNLCEDFVPISWNRYIKQETPLLDGKQEEVICCKHKEGRLCGIKTMQKCKLMTHWKLKEETD